MPTETAAPSGRVDAVVRRIRRWWARVSQPSTGGLQRHGDWWVRYPNGKLTFFMSYGDAENLRRCFGGTVEWRHDA